WLTDVLGITTEAESSSSATPSGAPAEKSSAPYQFPQPKNPFTLMWWLLGLGLFLILIAWLISRHSSSSVK
ncbi:hypothetical protein HY949_01385, partial [Candidatus Gottesmanbacteria bacterium]|nr:hypothetical protein [Candidatus Gottesmanbacteria bacterium]